MTGGAKMENKIDVDKAKVWCVEWRPSVIYRGL